MASDSTAYSSPEIPFWPRTITQVNDWDLSYMNDSLCISNLRDGLLAVVRVIESRAVKAVEINVWEYLSNYSPPDGRGFMFSDGDDSIVTLVQNQMEVSHSGGSMAWTMRHIEFIAKNGLTAHQEMFL